MGVQHPVRWLWFLLVAALMALAGCASPPSPTSLGASTNLNAENAGLAVGRTIATRDRWTGNRGFQLDFRNIDTGRFYSTAAGISGHTNFEHFALWVPPGRYRVNGIFAFGGTTGPVDSPFMFTIERGQATYIGTLINASEAPPDVARLGSPVAVKRYARYACPGFLMSGCDGPTPGMSTNSIVGRQPQFEFVVFDEGPGFAQALKAAHPNLPDLPIQRGIMR